MIAAPSFKAPVVDGFTMRPATQEDVDRVSADLREGERLEESASMYERTYVEEFDACWAVEAANGDLVGYFGIMFIPDNPSVRGFCFMSCTAADRHRHALVRSTRPCFAFAASQCPASVTAFWSWPAAEYRKSVRWQEKVLGMRRIGGWTLNGVDFVLLETTRREMEEWDGISS